MDGERRKRGRARRDPRSRPGRRGRRWEQGAPDASGPDPVLDALVDSVAAGVRLHALAGAYAAASPQRAEGAGTGGHPIAALDIAAALGPARLELNWLQAVPHA